MFIRLISGFLILNGNNLEKNIQFYIKINQLFHDKNNRVKSVFRLNSVLDIIVTTIKGIKIN